MDVKVRGGHAVLLEVGGADVGGLTEEQRLGAPLFILPGTWARTPPPMFFVRV